MGDGLRILIKRIIVCLQHLVVVALSVGLCISVFKPFGIECIDMSRSSAGPGHLETVDPDKISFLGCDISRALASLSPGSVHFLCIFISKMGRSRARQSALSLEGVGVVCQRQEVKVLHICRMLERLLHRTCSVGKVCVGMELSEVQAVILDLHGRLVCKCIDLAGLRLRIAALGDICQRLHHDRLILLRRRCDFQRLRVQLVCISRLRISRFCAVCIHCVVDLGSVSRFQGDLLSCHDTCSALRGRLYLKSFHCRRLIRLVRLIGAARHVRHLVELQGEHSLAALCNIVVRAPVSVAVIPLHVRSAHRVLHIVQTVSCILQNPFVVLLSQRHAGEAVPHTDILTIVREAVGSVLILCNGPHIRIRITAQCAVALFRHVCAFVIVTVILCRKRLAICRRIDHHPFAVRDGRCVSRLARSANRILQSLYRAVHALKYRSRLQRAVLCDHWHVVGAVKFSRLIRLIRRITSVQRIVNQRSGSGSRQRDLRPGSHSSCLGIRLRRSYCPL